MNIMSETKVVHCKNSSYDVYIGRAAGEIGKWGNPYSHKEGTTAKYLKPTRAEAIEAYRDYILKGDGIHLLNDLDELDGKVLGCWCKPKACHGDILIEIIQNMKQAKLF